MLTITAEQSAPLSYSATNPVYLIEAYWGGEPRRWSTNGDHNIAEVLWAGGVAGLRSLVDGRAGSFALVPTEANVTAFLSRDWRGRECNIWLYPIRVWPELIAEDYVVEDYGILSTEAGDPILLLDGIMTAAEQSGDGQISVSVVHAAQVNRWAPRHRLLPPVCNHLPAPGSTITWGGGSFTIEAR